MSTADNNPACPAQPNHTCAHKRSPPPPPLLLMLLFASMAELEYNSSERETQCNVTTKKPK